MSTTVQIRGWSKGLQKVSMTQLVRKHAKLGLREAKACTDAVLAGETVTLQLATERAAEKLVEALEEIHAHAGIVESR